MPVLINAESKTAGKSLNLRDIIGIYSLVDVLENMDDDQSLEALCSGTRL
jgi:hypothetical protein